MADAPYGMELILDLHDCNHLMFTRKAVELYCIRLCEALDLERCNFHPWVDHDSKEEHLKGVSAVQFLTTSNITVHALELRRAVHVNIFVCGEFDTNIAKEITRNFFMGTVKQLLIIQRP